VLRVSIKPNLQADLFSQLETFAIVLQSNLNFLKPSIAQKESQACKLVDDSSNCKENSESEGRTKTVAKESRPSLKITKKNSLSLANKHTHTSLPIFKTSGVVSCSVKTTVASNKTLELI
jgi:hypothetical protein